MPRDTSDKLRQVSAELQSLQSHVEGLRSNARPLGATSLARSTFNRDRSPVRLATAVAGDVSPYTQRHIAESDAVTKFVDWANSSVAALQEDRQGLLGALANREQTLETLNRELTQSAELLGEAKHAMSKHAEYVQQAETTQARLQGAINSLESRYDRLERERDYALDIAERVKSDVEARRQETHLLERRLSFATADLDEQKIAVARAESERQLMQQRLRNMEEALHRSEEDAARQRELVSKLRDELSDVSSNLAATIVQKEVQQHECHRLETQLASERRRAEDTLAQNAELLAHQRSLRMENDALRRDEDQLQRALSAAQFAAQTQSDLHTQLMTARSELHRTQLEYAELHDRLRIFEYKTTSPRLRQTLQTLQTLQVQSPADVQRSHEIQGRMREIEDVLQS